MSIEIVEKILLSNKLDAAVIVKKKYSKLPEYTAYDVVSRVVHSNGVPLSDVFPEMTRETSSKILKAMFPNKTNKQQNWFSYLLSTISHKKCSSCNNIKSFEEFNINVSSFDSLHSQCKICGNQQSKVYYLDNKDSISKNKKEYYYDNKDEILEKQKEYSKQHYQNNKAYYKAKTLARLNSLHAATPKWANMAEMNLVYSMCEEGYHVDHIIPLHGKLVCGLHVEHNLQYLPAGDNLAKGNKFDTETYVHTIEYAAPYLKQ